LLQGRGKPKKKKENNLFPVVVDTIRFIYFILLYLTNNSFFFLGCLGLAAVDQLCLRILVSWHRFFATFRYIFLGL